MRAVDLRDRAAGVEVDAPCRGDGRRRGPAGRCRRLVRERAGGQLEAVDCGRPRERRRHDGGGVEDITGR